MSFPDLLSAKALSERMGIAEGTLAKWRLSGEGPRYIQLQRRIAYDPQDVVLWLEARRCTSTSQLRPHTRKGA